MNIKHAGFYSFKNYQSIPTTGLLKKGKTS